MLDQLLVKFHEYLGLSEKFRRERVQSAKHEFDKFLMKVEDSPMDEKIVGKSYELGWHYYALAKYFDIVIGDFGDDLDTAKDISVARFKGLNKGNLKNLDDSEADEIMVAVGGNWGNTPMTLTEWINRGPGMRFLRQPYRAWSLRTGEELPLDIIPIQYRNNEESRKKIKNGEISDPWDFETDY